MPRLMRRFDTDLAAEGKSLIGLARAGEIVRHAAGPGTPGWTEWPIARLEAIYELAFLRMFVAWETFLDDSFHSYMCGYASRHGQEAPVANYYPTIEAAEIAVLGGQDFVTWYKPFRVISRCQQHVANGRHEAVFTAHVVWLTELGTIRHRIAHGQTHAMQEFDNTTNAWTGKKYRGSRPGTFLRDWNGDDRWLETLVKRISHLASQIV
jgi:hypothetical protein